MASELLKARVERKGLRFDARTKLLLLITMACVVLGGVGGGEMESFRLALSFVPTILLWSAGKWKQGILYTAGFSVCYLLNLFVFPRTSGLVSFLLLGICGFVTRFMPSIMVGRFVMATTTVSEFIATMERMHVTEKIVIPMSVIFRFFPTIREEFAAISDAMRMRGIRFGGGKVSAMLEYRMIPMMICSVKIGEELSAAALTRGLGAPVRRTNICEIGFRAQDVVVIAACLLTFAIAAFYTVHAG